MLALLIYCYANGIFSSRRIERASYRDIGVRFVAANPHPDHDTVAVFRRANKAAFEAAFLQVLLLARESGLLRLGMVSIDGTKLDTNASKIRSVRYDRAQELRAKLATDIAALTAQAEAADAEGSTLSDANARRPVAIFAEIFAQLSALADHSLKREGGEMLRLIDSTPIPLGDVAGWADWNGRTRGLKLHVVYDPQADHPRRIDITPATVNDVLVGERVPIETGATYVIDKGYCNTRGGPASTGAAASLSLDPSRMPGSEWCAGAKSHQTKGAGRCGCETGDPGARQAGDSASAGADQARRRERSDVDHQ